MNRKRLGAIGMMLGAFLVLGWYVLPHGRSRAAPLLEPLAPNQRVERVVPDNLNFPIAMAFAPDGRLFYTEKTTGNVRVIQNGALVSTPVITLPTDGTGERGLLGIALAPNFATSHLVYVYHTLPGSPPANRVVRFREQNGTGIEATPLLTVPVTTGATNHNGGNLHFGSDGKLYVTIGEYNTPSWSQNGTVIPGKIHRFNAADMSAPADNPFMASVTVTVKSIYALGLRTSFDFAFDPFSGRMFASENGPGCDDEVNLIVAGGNYGWRSGYPCDDNSGASGYRAPLRFWTPTIAPTGIHIYSGNLLSQWTGNLFMCAWNNGNLYRWTLNAQRTGITSESVVDLGGIGCTLDLETGPDGALYFSTSSWGTNTGAIYRITSDTPTATPTRTPTRTRTPTATFTRTPTRTPTKTLTRTPTRTRTPTATLTRTPSPAASPTPTASGTPTPSRTVTPTGTPTLSGRLWLPVIVRG
ncbi:MAG: PQQ-dependent sugar dehydrogenase [Anaerolineae bacterium]|nr:PQQ-dependent sugar dehydrogenase [Anaerolineae bacterium]